MAHSSKTHIPNDPPTTHGKGKKIDTWQPLEARMTDTERQVVLPVLRATVQAALGNSADDTKVKLTLSALLPFYLDAHRSGIDINNTREVLSDIRTADVLRADTATKYTTKLTYRSRAREVRCRLHPETKPKPLSASKAKGLYENPQAPYLADFLEDCYLRAFTEGTAYRSSSLCAGLALTGGNGSHIKDLRYTKVEHIEIRDDGTVIVHYPAEAQAERSVPMSSVWAPRLLEAIAHLNPGDYIFLPTFRDREYVDLANQAVERSTDLKRFRWARARIHWLVSQMEAGIDLRTLTHWAGLAKCEGVARYARYLTPADESDLYTLSMEARPHEGGRS